MKNDPFNTIQSLTTPFGNYKYYSIKQLEADGITELDRLPFSIRILLESVLHQVDDIVITKDDVLNLANWQPAAETRGAMPFKPGRVIMQDFTGVPAIVDLAAMRSAMARLGGDPKLINPVVPVDLVIDHSVQVDFFTSEDALQRNAELEFQRNIERYEFLHWGQKAFDNFRVVPPSTGIIHQVNLEYLASSVLTRKEDDDTVVFAETLVGTDSHTTMINGLGVVGWGVGGIEAEAALLGQAIDMLTPDVIGFKLSGELREGVTPTDMTLTIVQMLRKSGVVGKFIEFFGAGLSSISLADRAMIANMSPENGATITWFPVDDKTIEYLKLTGRPEEIVALAEAYYKAQGLYRTDATPDPEFTRLLELDLSAVKPSLAGPKLPHERLDLNEIQQDFKRALTTPKDKRGYAVAEDQLDNRVKVGSNGHGDVMAHGSVVIAAITSCTNTSNPAVMIGAGLVAQKAVELGMRVPMFVKTSLAPGSTVVTEYLSHAGLLEPLAKLGFNLVGYGCTTCIGNSGPLSGEVVRAITEGNLIAAGVLSGNRNFEGRIHPYSLANYLASPPLVVAYALAGSVDIDLTKDPLGKDKDGNAVYLKDVWPTNEEVQAVIAESVLPSMFAEKYANVFDSNPTWNAIEGGDAEIYGWKEDSTYIQEPPFFMDLTLETATLTDITGAKALAVLGDAITTDHISPAGAIPTDSAAGQYLLENGVKEREFNSFGSRRGNDQVMTRGTFANIRLKNQLVPGVEGGYTTHLPTGEKMTIFDAAQKYKEAGTPTIILGGKLYGSGSSRDWAAKGTLLLGVKAVITESYERIHRSNLVGMGVLPLQFKAGETPLTLGLDGTETFSISGISDDMGAASTLQVTAEKADGSTVEFEVISRLDTEVDVEYLKHGGILHAVLRDRLG